MSLGISELGSSGKAEGVSLHHRIIVLDMMKDQTTQHGGSLAVLLRLLLKVANPILGN